MALSQTDRTLRLITIWAWIPAMCLLIPYGVEAREPCLPLGLIPMTVSAVFGLHKVQSKSTQRYFTIFMDVLLACSYLSDLVPGLIIMAYLRNWHRSQVQMLGAYASTPLLLNL